MASEFEKKAQKYFNDTNAFTKLRGNLFNETLNQVIQLLNYLRSKNYILNWQYEEMMPDRKTAELAYLCFNPKTHKVLWTSLIIIELSSRSIQFRMVYQCDLLKIRFMLQQQIFQNF